jgi:L-asparaginase II
VARLIVEVTRGDRVESRHRGSIAAVSPSGELVWSFGDADEFAYIRSAAKPFQLAPFVASGRFDAYDFPNPTEALAVMAASHSGEDRHVRTVQAILRAGGLTREVLACGTHPPYDRETAQRLIRDGEPLTPLRHNCSGKHAGMALHAKAAGWPIESYWEPDHPVQQLALDTIALMSGVPRSEIATATDGCGVVSFGLPIRGLALAFARLADPSGVEDPALRAAFERIRDAMMAHPELVGGDRRRFDTELMRARPGDLVSKGGAEGIKAVGVLRKASAAPFGLGLKIEDGDLARRAGDVAASAALARLGVLDADALHRLGDHAAPRIVDPRGNVVGEVRAVLG